MSKLSKEEKKRYQIVSRILGIFMRIANVCCWIGVGGVVVAALLASVLVPNIKIDSANKEISLFDKTSSYTIKGQEFELGGEDGGVTIKDNVVTISGKDSDVVSVKLSDNSLNEIEKVIENDVPRILNVLPFVLVLTAVLLGVYALALGHGASVFRNIAKEETPFIKENIERTEKSFRYMFAAFILTFVIDLIMAVATGFKSNIGMETASITGLLTIYVSIYILKAGYQLGDKKD